MSGDKFEAGESSQDSTTAQTVKEHNLLASNYAMQVAVQTMKERCHQLQCRLSIVEDENLRLRIEKQKLTSSMLTNESKNDISPLQEQVAQLTRQKSQLTNHILMVATENKQLWTRLSKLTEANQSLGNHLTQISETLNKHPLGDSTKPNQSISIVNSCEKDKEPNESKEESLEEISLKLINSIMREKMELEQQCEQMVELQTGAVSVEDCGFTLGSERRTIDTTIRTGDDGIDDEAESEGVLQDIRRIVDKLKEEKDVLQQQQAGLRSAVTSLSHIIKNGLPCQKCQNKAGDDIKSTNIETKPVFNTSLSGNQNRLDEIHRQLKQVSEPPSDVEDNKFNITKQEGHTGTVEDYTEFEDRICPLCEKFYHRSAKFEEFHRHVLTHFSNEDNEYDSLVNNFEVIT